MIAYLDQQQQQILDPNSGADSPAGLDSDFNISGDPSPAATDFGGVVTVEPLAFIHPSTPDDVARAIRLAGATDGLTVAARGNGHSVSGQAMADGGLVLDMRALARSAPRMELVEHNGRYAVDVCGGALWEEVLEWGVESHGLAPASWTDYLRLTVGGTLSVGGVSGQAFRHGPQVSNVEELEIVTGDGERRVCSPATQPDLFYGALGGLGQFGVIVRARVRLVPAHKMVKWIRVVYTEFSEYAADAETLVKGGDEKEMFDYVEGFAFVNDVDDPVNGWRSVPVPSGPEFDPASVPSGSGRILYCLELALYYNDRNSDSVDERLERLLRPLRYVRGLEFAVDVGYVEFLTRVKRAEEEARANGFWHGPHPWLNILVASSNISDFDRCVFKDLLKDGIGGPMLVYPLLRSKWDERMSVAVPADEVFYLVALLRFTSPSDTNNAIAQNQKIVEVCKSSGYDFKVYIPHYKTEDDWVQHFDKDWPRFVSLKNRYDPLAILAPGQRIFPRAR